MGNMPPPLPPRRPTAIGPLNRQKQNTTGQVRPQDGQPPRSFVAANSALFPGPQDTPSLLESNTLHPRPRHHRGPLATPWPLLAVDRHSIHGLSRLQAAARRTRRVQRQVHVQPGHPARCLLRHSTDPRARDVPQFLLTRHPLAVQRYPPGARLLTVTTHLPPPNLAVSSF